MVSFSVKKCTMVSSLLVCVASAMTLATGAQCSRHGNNRSSSPSAESSSSVTNYWFSFGDSYTETGFLYNGTLPNDQNPIGNPTFPGYTSANGGENWLGFAATKYNNTKIYIYNYAYSGATVDADLVPPYATHVQTLTNQVNRFLSTAAICPPETQWSPANTLFSIWIGINDIDLSYHIDGDRNAFSDQVLDAYFALVEKLYRAGARNFLFANVPPIDRSPKHLREDQLTQAKLKNIIDTYNTKLATRVSTLRASRRGIQTFLWDSNSQFTKILNSPARYGFTNATAVGVGPDSFWLNDLHPTTFGHRFLGEEVGNMVLGRTIW